MALVPMQSQNELHLSDAEGFSSMQSITCPLGCSTHREINLHLLMIINLMI